MGGKAPPTETAPQAAPFELDQNPLEGVFPNSVGRSPPNLSLIRPLRPGHDFLQVGRTGPFGVWAVLKLERTALPKKNWQDPGLLSVKWLGSSSKIERAPSDSSFCERGGHLEREGRDGGGGAAGRRGRKLLPRPHRLS